MKNILLISTVFIFLAGFTPFEKETPESREGRKKYAAGDMEGAKSEFEKASERLENSAEAYYDLGNSLQRSGDNEGALNSYRKSLETGGADNQLKAKIFHNMGNSLAAMQKYKEAEDFFIRSLMEDPQDDTAENLEIVRRIIRQQEQQKQEQQKQDQEQKEEQKQDQEKEDQQQEQKEDQQQEQKEEQKEDQQQEQNAAQAEEKEEEEKKEDGKEEMMQQFRQRKNLQISPFMLKKDARSKNGQTW
ncbi:MAG TPA: tetratricopeptide repeat protein [bacterium]|jgi:tetratricopeptide (TPR) repeat protein|nr:tetratricopeptide repeat protein [bacterium]MDX9804503.1 tetratricopeptide repeat protein [bacterium]HPG35887.1 tetratricopeptide repeat protein [bacterium]HPM46421.1 tetratricopeptide repeat protein [bacterium]HPV20542.1 tetratricopeptide repeat protein [bacterium]